MFGALRFQRDNAIGRQVENIEPAISNKAKIRRRCNRKAGVEERGVFHCISIETLRAELEHVAERGGKEGGCSQLVISKQVDAVSEAISSTHGVCAASMCVSPFEMYMGIGILRCCFRIACASWGRSCSITARLLTGRWPSNHRGPQGSAWQLVSYFLRHHHMDT